MPSFLFRCLRLSRIINHSLLSAISCATIFNRCFRFTCSAAFGWRATTSQSPKMLWGRQKTKSLLKILLTHRGHAVTKDQLIEWLWADQDVDAAGRDLRVAVSHLRRALEPQLPRGSQSNFILITESGYAFSADAECYIDAEEFGTSCARFEAAVKTELIDTALETAERARAVYRGDYLGEDRYADWSATRREQLREMFFSLLTGMAELYARQRRYAFAIELSQHVLAADRVCENVWRDLMLYHYHDGDLALALRAFDDCQHVLRDELGVEPLPETRALYERVHNREIERQSQTIPTNLAAHTPPTPFVGREEERAEIARRLNDSTCRLLTLTGAGGIGKSRLALQVGADLLEQFRDGVYFVPLASVSESDLIVSAMANALKISFYGREEPRVQLRNYLRSKQMLLIADNFEHLLVGATLLTDLLQSAPEMKILVTARQPLNLHAEWIFAVEGLNYPRAATQAVISSPSTSLGIDSARNLDVAARDFSQEPLETLAPHASAASYSKFVKGLPARK